MIITEVRSIATDARHLLTIDVVATNVQDLAVIHLVSIFLNLFEIFSTKQKQGLIQLIIDNGDVNIQQRNRYDMQF